MKAFLCITLAAAASAAPQLLAGHGLIGHGGVGHGLVGHGVVGHAVAHGVGYNDLAEISPYTYQYAVADDYSGAAFQQTESDDGTGLREGSYSVNLPDGRIQHVNYHANDATGYVAEVTYDGTASYPDVVGVGHGVVGHGLTHGVVGHGLSHGLGHVGHGVVGHAVAHPAVIGHGLGHGIIG